MNSKRMYDSSGRLFNEILDRFQLKNDAALCVKLGVSAPVISKIRTGVHQVSSDIILRIHEKLRMPVTEIRTLIATHSGIEYEDE